MEGQVRGGDGERSVCSELESPSADTATKSTDILNDRVITLKQTGQELMSTVT